LVQALKQQDVTHGENPAVQEAMARLGGILKDSGVDGVVNELERVSARTVPQGAS